MDTKFEPPKMTVRQRQIQLLEKKIAKSVQRKKRLLEDIERLTESVPKNQIFKRKYAELRREMDRCIRKQAQLWDLQNNQRSP